MSCLVSVGANFWNFNIGGGRREKKKKEENGERAENARNGRGRVYRYLR